MSERKQCEFFLIRYVPDPVRNEFVNIGVMLREAPGQGVEGAPALRFTRDWSRVRCMDGDADTDMLEALEGELQVRLLDGREHGFKTVLEVVEDSFSNMLQITPAKGYLVPGISAGLEELMRVYVEARKQESTRKRSGRANIQAAMRMRFESAGVWGLMRKRIAAATYTKAGDPLKIDCGYRPNGVVRMFHAVSLENDTELAKVLAFSAKGLREGVARVEGATLQLTAVIEPLKQIQRYDGDEEATASYRFAVETMEASEVRVMTTTDLPRMAETARMEMRL